MKLGHKQREMLERAARHHEHRVDIVHAGDKRTAMRLCEYGLGEITYDSFAWFRINECGLAQVDVERRAR